MEISSREVVKNLKDYYLQETKPKSATGRVRFLNQTDKVSLNKKIHMVQKKCVKNELQTRKKNLDNLTKWEVYRQNNFVKDFIMQKR